MSIRLRISLSLALLLGCSHSDPFVTRIPMVGPLTAGADVRLTLNSDQDYWPTWTEDGSGILYAFVDPDLPRHRCVGLLPPAGGTRYWQMCHNGVAYDDSNSSFTAYALGSNGRLLYAEAVSLFVPGVPAPGQAAPYETTLWLADSAAPFTRTALLSIPLTLADGTAVFWLSDMAWTGANTFIALGQNLAIVRHCFGTGFPADPACDFSDSVFSTGGPPAGAVVRGTITGGHATLTAVPGTDGATGYSVAENGASIVFTKRDDGSLYKVPAAGGAVTTVGMVPSPLRPGYQVFGVSCRGSNCIAATDSATLTRLEPTKIFPLLRGGYRELRSISLVTGISGAVTSYSDIISAPAVSPITGDVVLQIGGTWGHLQTFAGSVPSDLHLLRGLVP